MGFIFTWGKFRIDGNIVKNAKKILPMQKFPRSQFRNTFYVHIMKFSTEEKYAW